jgi:hypothetical protein
LDGQQHLDLRSRAFTLRADNTTANVFDVGVNSASASLGSTARDPQQSETPNEKHAPCLAVALQQRADALFSAHAHLFECITYTDADRTIMPCLIVGCGETALNLLSLFLNLVLPHLRCTKSFDLQ